MRSRLIRFASVAAVVAIAVSACSIDVAPRGGSDPVDPAVERTVEGSSGGATVEAVVRRVLPAVVNVTTDVFGTDEFGNAQEGQGVGTGFIVRSDGVIVTNCHVVEGGSRISVFTSDEDPTRYEARLIGADCAMDLAVLKVDATGLPTLRLGSSSDLQLGQKVVALGYALALEGGPSVTTGIVSSLDRTIEVADPGCPATSCPDGTRTYSDVIQTDAAINHGNSGGPLVDMGGRVVGINSAGSEGAENIGFAIAVDAAKAVVEGAMAEPLSAAAYLGVTTQGVTNAVALQLGLPVEQGAYVLGTTPDGPAAGAGIAQGDVIVGIDGREVAATEDVAAILTDLRPGETIEVRLVAADGTARTVEVKLGTRPLPIEIP